MADFAASILAPTVDSAMKYVGAIIKRQFIYLFCFSSNIIVMKDEAKKLDDAVQGVQAQVNEVTNNAQEIHPEVTSWLGDSEKFINEMNIILNEVPNVKGGCLRLASRFSLSRRAKKTTEAIEQHRQKSNFNKISLPPPAAATKEIPLGTTYMFDSRKKIEQEIMKTLRDEEENMIAIHGMGGLGKTTMAKRIMNALLREQVFNEVVMAVVSQQVDKLKIQLDIGGALGLKNLQGETAQARAQILHARLSAGTTRILIVMDDVWEKLVLENLGIPCNSEKCTILITSRNSDALRAMDVKNVFEMEQLSEEDAWFMFREKAGTCVDDKKLRCTAKQVMRECKGLPIALEALGAALKDEKSKSIWNDTLKKLRKPNPKNTPHYIAEVYNPLIVSYDKLDEEAKSLFLLCCLFSEDDDISLSKLTYFSMGLHLFEDLGSLGEARDRMCSLVKMLKSRSLLFDGYDEGHVKMHDVVRDICIFIAKLKGYIGGNDCTWISDSQILEAGIELFKEFGFLNLHLLFSNDEEFKIDNTFFEGMRELYVLSIRMYSCTSLPHTQSLNKLRTLLLYNCDYLETISVVGDLVHLEIFICRWCMSIKELPHKIRGLKHLKLLELTHCQNLQSIGRDIISSLVELEELKILSSFDKWEVADDRQINAGLIELEALTKLTCLEIEIADPTLVAQEINLSSKIERFDIKFDKYNTKFPKRSNKNLILRWDEGTCLGNWIEKLLKDTECLYLIGKGTNDLDFQNLFPNIQWLKLEECGGIKSIGMTSMDDDGVGTPLLQSLKNIELSYLPALKHLWKSNTNIVSLPQLENLLISNCEMMEQLFLWGEEEENETNRGSLNCDVTKIQGVKFPLLRKMSMMNCPKMRSIIPTTSLNGYGSTIKADIDDHSLHLFCQPEKVSFGSLKDLQIQRNPFCLHNHIYVPFFNKLEKLFISKYGGSMSLFRLSVARSLVNLKELRIVMCDEMVAVIEDDKEDGTAVSGGERNILFPNLQELWLFDLSKLVTFCNLKKDVELPSLKNVTIMRCPNMTNLSLAPLALEDNVVTDLDSYLGVLFKVNGNQSCNLHKTRIFSFTNGLQRLNIHEYQGCTSIFSALIAENLTNLAVLHIGGCFRMVKVIEGGERSSTLLFPKLQQLHLCGLPKLEIFCQWESDVELPLLKDVNIAHCPNMKKFTLGSITTPCLDFVRIDWTKSYTVDGSTDLNGALQQHFAKEEENIEVDEDEDGDREGDASSGDGDVEIEKATEEAHEGEDEQSTSNEEKKGQEGLNK